MCTGVRYPGSFIGDDNSKREWLKECTDTWERNITNIRKTTGEYPQEIYAAVVCAIQLGWGFLQRVMDNTGDAFEGVVKKIIALAFYLESKISHTPHSKYNYNVGQEIWTGPPESLDIRKRKISKFAMCKHRVDSRCDRGRRVFQRRLPSGTQVIKD